jgi:MFS family permease
MPAEGEGARDVAIPPNFWRRYLTLSFVIFSGFVALGSAGPFQALYAVSLGASLSQVALIAGGYTTVGLFAGLAWGRLADDPRRRIPMIALALATMAAVLLLEATVSLVTADRLPIPLAPWMLLVPLRLIEGTAWAASQVASMAMMGDLLAGDARRPRLVSAYRMSGSLAFSVAIVVSGTVSQGLGYAASFVVASSVFVAGFLAAVSLPRDPLSSSVGSPSHGSGVSRSIPLREIASGPMRPVLLLALAFGLPFSMVYGVWPIWVANDRGFGQAAYSQLWGLAAFVEVPCMVVAGWLIARVGSARTFAVGMATFAAIYTVYGAAPPLWVLFVVQAIRGFGFAAYTATSLTMAIELAPPTARGRASGLYQSAQGLAQILGNWVGPPLAGVAGYPPVFGVAAVVVAGGALFALRLARPDGGEPTPSVRT